ncbi:MAG TPA: hypothetical protein VGK55_07725 [Actinomycetes bacterium]
MSGLLDWPTTGDVVRWLLHAPPTLEQLAVLLERTAAAVEEVRAELRRVLGETAVSLGWSGTAAESASTAAAAQCDQLDSLRGVQAALATTLSAAAREFDDMRARLMRLATFAASAPLDPLSTLATIRHADHLRAVVNSADSRFAASIDALADCLDGLARPVYAGRWLSSAAPPGAAYVLESHGLTAGPPGADLVAWAASLSPGEDGSARLRARLATLPVAELAVVIEANPFVARRLAAGGDDPPTVTAGRTEGAQIPAAIAGALLAARGPGRVAAIRQAAAALPASARRRFALLFPRLAGSLDGLAFADRVAANRVLVTAALDAELERRHAVLARLDDRENHHDPLDLLADEASRLWDWMDDTPPVNTFVADFDGDPADAAVGSDARVALYRSVLSADRQVLAFDERGDGVFVELFGAVDPHTRNVAVLVPGTGIDLSSYHQWADLARDFQAGADDLAVVAWMGDDFPDTLTAAAGGSSAEDAAPRLRDFMAGLDIPSTTRSTVLGYSYGGAVVGTAEREGLVADQVLHVESAGAGAGVTGLDDYAGGVGQHYTMTAPGDPIRLVRGIDIGGLGHGGDPDRMPGFLRLPTGCHRPDDPDHPGEPIQGLSAHWDVFSRGSTAWESMRSVMIGRPAPDTTQCRP